MTISPAFRNSKFWYQTHNWLVHKLLWESLCDVIPKYVNGVVFDLGCGRKPYANLLSPYANRYLTFDYSIRDPSKPPQAIMDAHSLGLAEATADTVVLTEVLEHLPNPKQAIREICRVLKPGGIFLLTTPFIWHVHEAPHDYYRYTRFGLSYLLESEGFEVTEVKETSGFIATFFQLLCYFLLNVRLGGFGIVVFKPVIWFLQRFAYVLNKLDTTTNLTMSYVVVARKLS